MSYWAPVDRDTFLKKLRELWPASAGQIQGELSLVYTSAVSGFGLDQALDGLRALKTQGQKWLPEVPDVVEAVRKAGRVEIDHENEHRKNLIARLRLLCERDFQVVGYVLSHRTNLWWELNPWGLMCRDTSPRKAVLWRDMPTEHLEHILRENEMHIHWEPVLDPKSFKDSLAILRKQLSKSSKAVPV